MNEFLKVAQFPGSAVIVRGMAPSWSRLEPQSITGDPTPGLEARVHDPLWLLSAQYQLGEFVGEDAGSPIGVEFSLTTGRLTRWQAGLWNPPAGVSANPVRNLEPEHLLEPVVESEPADVAGPGARAGADAGAVFLAALSDAGLGALRDAVVTACPITAPDGDAFDANWNALAALLAGRGVDGRQLAEAIDAAAGNPSGVPPWLAPADPTQQATLTSVVNGWRQWYRDEIAPAPDTGGDAWVGARLEYDFSVAGQSAAGETVLRAPEFTGGAIDWFSFDLDPGASLGVSADGALEQSGSTVAATPLRFAGMPAERVWEFEDAQVNLGGLQVEPHDLARLLLVEFALTYGNDWLVVPLQVPFGSLTTINWLIYTTTFGERYVVGHPRSTRPADPWRMFAITTADGSASLDALLVPPAAVTIEEGAIQEDVLFLRDEVATMAWAVERTVQGKSGDPRTRADEHTEPAPPGPGPVAADLDYLLETRVPEQWIPYLPQTDGFSSIRLVQGSMLRFDAEPGEAPPGPDGVEVLPVGRLLTEAGTQSIVDAEVPREGVRVRRVPVLARTADGSYHRWIARRVSTGRGEGSSGLAFDGTLPRKT